MRMNELKRVILLSQNVCTNLPAVITYNLVELQFSQGSLKTSKTDKTGHNRPTDRQTDRQTVQHKHTRQTDKTRQTENKHDRQEKQVKQNRSR